MLRSKSHSIGAPAAHKLRPWTLCPPETGSLPPGRRPVDKLPSRWCSPPAGVHPHLLTATANGPTRRADLGTRDSLDRSPLPPQIAVDLGVSERGLMEISEALGASRIGGESRGAGQGDGSGHCWPSTGRRPEITPLPNPPPTPEMRTGGSGSLNGGEVRRSRRNSTQIRAMPSPSRFQRRGPDSSAGSQPGPSR